MAIGVKAAPKDGETWADVAPWIFEGKPLSAEEIERFRKMGEARGWVSE